MVGLILVQVFIIVLFLLTGWIDKKVDKKDFSHYAINFGIVLVILFFLVLAITVEQIINYLIVNYVN